MRHGHLDEASALEAKVAGHYPSDPDLLELRALRVRQKPECLLELAEDVLAEDAGNAHALYYKAVALAQLGRRSQACELMDLDRLVRVETLAVPPDFKTPRTFFSELANEILGNATFHSDPAGHATRKGLRTAIFPASDDHAAVELLDRICRQVELYSGDCADHPFVAGRPAEARFTAWALVFRGGGHQRVHNHPGSWLTGVYYVRTPGGTGGPGTLRIGVLPEWAGDPPWPVLEISPEPGRLVMFPSFVPHDTVPTGQDQERISVAFDVADADR